MVTMKGACQCYKETALFLELKGTLHGAAPQLASPAAYTLGQDLVCEEKFDNFIEVITYKAFVI